MYSSPFKLSNSPDQNLYQMDTSSSRINQLSNGKQKNRSRSYWDYKNIHSEQKQKDMQGINRSTVLKDLERERNPFLMGGLRKDKFIYSGNNQQNESVAYRLNGYWTIQRGNSAKITNRSPTDQSKRVKALPNIYDACHNSNIVTDILREKSIFQSKPEMLDTIAKMKEQKLLTSQHQHHITTHGKGGRVKYTYNDYHSRITNPGYSRTAFGTFYYR